jgi:hypothetical protein
VVDYESSSTSKLWPTAYSRKAVAKETGHGSWPLIGHARLHQQRPRNKRQQLLPNYCRSILWAWRRRREATKTERVGGSYLGGIVPLVFAKPRRAHGCHNVRPLRQQHAQRFIAHTRSYFPHQDIACLSVSSKPSVCVLLWLKLVLMLRFGSGHAPGHTSSECCLEKDCFIANHVKTSPKNRVSSERQFSTPDIQSE